MFIHTCGSVTILNGIFGKLGKIQLVENLMINISKKERRLSN